MFITLPKVFDSMTGGTIIGVIFFILVFFAALTSSISLMETVVSIFRDKFNWSRTKTCLLVFIGSLILGLPSSLGFGVLGNFTVAGLTFLDMFDFISNSVLMPIVALLTCIFVGYIIKPKAIIEEIEIGAPFKAKTLFTIVIKYIAPICIVLILISSVLSAFGIMKI
jgi:NSS family neurotransmitter:Na+ symporter